MGAASRVQGMSLSIWGLELIRELRFWAPASTCASCPWGAIIGLLLVLTCLCGCCLGACGAIIAVSDNCRKLLVLGLRLCTQGCGAPTVAEPISQRLAEYRLRRTQ